MNRSARAHRSTKVPGVKLRPAPPVQHNAASTSAADAGKSNDELAREEDAAHFRAMRDTDVEKKLPGPHDASWTQVPLRGATLCFSSMHEEKPELKRIAMELGAVVEDILTSDATHLVARETTSAKYKGAVELGIPVLKSSWLREVRRAYVEDDDVDPDQLLKEHALAPLEGVQVGLAGYSEERERHDLRQRIADAGAITVKALVLQADPCPASHIVCHPDSPKESLTLQSIVRYRKRAERFTRRGAELPESNEDYRQLRNALNMICVREEWFEDCVRVGRCLPEAIYEISKPKPTSDERKALIEPFLTAQSQWKDRMAHFARAPSPTRGAADVATRNVERVGVSTTMRNITKGSKAMPDTDSAAAPKAGLMGISRAAAFETSAPAAAKAKTSKPRHLAEATIEPESQRTKAAHVANAKPASKIVRPVQGESASSCVGEVSTDIHPPSGDTSVVQLPNEGGGGVFRDLTLRVDLPDPTEDDIVRKAIRDAGATIVDALNDQKADYCIVPLGAKDPVQGEPSPATRGRFVTHLWVERCIYTRTIVDPAAYIGLRPSPFKLPLPAAQNLILAKTRTSKTEVDDLQISKVMDALGIRIVDVLKRGQCTHLFGGSGDKSRGKSEKKIKSASEWGIPLVSFDFVRRLFEEGVVKPEGAILKTFISTAAGRSMSEVGNSQVQTSSNSSTPAPAPVNNSGAKPGNDITNGEVLQHRSAHCDKASNDVSMAAPHAPRQRSTLDVRCKERGAKAEAESSSGARLASTPRRAAAAAAAAALHEQSLAGGSYVAKEHASEVVALLKSRNALNGTADSSSGRIKSAKPPPRSRSSGKRANSNGLDSSISPEKRARHGSTVSARDSEGASTAADDGAAQVAALLPPPSPAVPEPRWLAEERQRAERAAVSSSFDEQSMRVFYDDPNTSKERAKLEDMMKRAALEAAPSRSTTGAADTTQDDDAPLTPRKRAAVEDTFGGPRRYDARSPSRAGASPASRIKARKQPGMAARR